MAPTGSEYSVCSRFFMAALSSSFSRAQFRAIDLLGHALSVALVWENCSFLLCVESPSHRDRNSPLCCCELQVGLQ